MRDVYQTGLRLPKSLSLKLKREAGRHGVSFNAEVRMRLEDSLEKFDAPRALDAIQENMRVVWARYENRLLWLDLEEDLVTRLQQSTDLTVVALANSWILHQEKEREYDRRLGSKTDPNKPLAPMPSPLLTRAEGDAWKHAIAPKLRAWPKRRTKKGGVS